MLLNLILEQDDGFIIVDFLFSVIVVEDSKGFFEIRTITPLVVLLAVEILGTFFLFAYQSLSGGCHAAGKNQCHDEGDAICCEMFHELAELFVRDCITFPKLIILLNKSLVLRQLAHAVETPVAVYESEVVGHTVVQEVLLKILQSLVALAYLGKHGCYDIA